jgi:hypothetical protein
MTTEVVENVGTANTGNQDDAAAIARAGEGLGEDVVVSDATPQTQHTDAGDPPEPVRPQRRLSDSDEMRNAIVDNFRRRRAAGEQNNEAAEDARQIQEFMRSGGMPKEFQDTFVDDQPPAGDVIEEHVEEVLAEPEPPPAPRKIKIKVNGKELELTEEELIARAQMNEAADERLSEAKTILSQVNALKRDWESRPSPTATPAVDSAATEGQPSDTGDQHQVDPYKETTETLLYGDPDAAAKKLRELHEHENAKLPAIVEQVLNRERVRTEHSRSMASLKRLERENEDLAKDPMASAALSASIFAHQRNDLVNMGLDAGKLPTDNAAIANLHLKFRSDPATSGLLRTPDELFNAAKTDFLKWRPGTPPAQTNGNGNGTGTHPQRTETPPIQVDVNRTARRMAIPPQPSRTAVVKQTPPSAPPPKTRSQTILEMRKSRGQEV